MNGLIASLSGLDTSSSMIPVGSSMTRPISTERPFPRKRASVEQGPYPGTSIVRKQLLSAKEVPVTLIAAPFTGLSM